MDRRQHIRFALRAPVSFFSQERGGVRLEGNGFTRDVSERGVFVLSDTQVPLGEAIQLEIVVYSPGTTSVVHMSAKGRLLRVEHSSGTEHMGGFAAAISSLEFRNGTAGGGIAVASRIPGGAQPC